MKDNLLSQFFQQFRGKIASNVYIPLAGKAEPGHLAFLRSLEKDLDEKREKSLYAPLNELNVVIFDFETTGFFPEKGDSILSIGAVKMAGGQLDEKDTFYSLVRFGGILTDEIRQLTGLDEKDLKTAPPLAEVLIRFYQFVQNAPLVAHHASHEKRFLQHANWKAFKKTYFPRIIDTSLVFNMVHKDKKIVSLDDYCVMANIEIENRHHALGDAILLAKLWQIYVEKLKDMGCQTLKDVYEQLALSRINDVP